MTALCTFCTSELKTWTLTIIYVTVIIGIVRFYNEVKHPKDGKGNREDPEGESGLGQHYLLTQTRPKT